MSSFSTNQRSANRGSSASANRVNRRLHSDHGPSSSANRGAGIVMKWRRGGDTRYLLLKGADTGIWSFPKGHTEPEDVTPLDTAVREVSEETGLRVDLDYRLTRQSTRYGRNLYWEAETTHYFTPKITLRSREHSTYLWLTFDEIINVKASKVNRDIREWVKRLNPACFAHGDSCPLASAHIPSPLDMAPLDPLAPEEKPQPKPKMGTAVHQR